MLIGTLHLPTDPRSKGPGGQGKRTFHLDVVSRFHPSGMTVPGTLPFTLWERPDRTLLLFFSST